MNVRLACSLALLLFGSPAVAADDFIDLRSIRAVNGDPDAVRNKLELCSACHGADGSSPVPMLPHLGGLSAEYQYWQLYEFKHAGRPESPMTAIIQTIDEKDLADYAAYYASHPPPAPAPLDESEPSPDLARGGNLYLRGDPDAGVPPCQGCHGANGEGHPLAAESPYYRTYPRLRGQHATYVAQRLRDFRDGKLGASSNDRIMESVARDLSDADIAAIAAWLQTGGS